jgi:aspartate aminotransferase
MSLVAQRLAAIKASPTLAITAKAAKLKSEGKDIIGLGAGEPDFDTPQFIKDAATAALAKGLTKYTPAGGTGSLKKAIIAKFKRDNGLTYTEKQILVSCGGKHTLFNMCMALLNPGDEVIVPAPYWVSYPDMAMVAGAKPVFIHAGIEQGFKITPVQLERAITPQTRLIFINSPSNPTGAVYTLEELKALGEVLRKHPRILIASDDMYEKILLDGSKFVNILDACPDLFDRTLVENGVSKAYSMTGWRIGYCGGPAELIEAMENMQSHSTSNPTSISQWAAEAALNGDQSCIPPMVKAFKERAEWLVAALNKIPGVRCLQPAGAFYVFPDCSEAIRRLHAAGKIKAATDMALCDYLMEQPEAVAPVPGSAFGGEGCIRISFATSLENLQKAAARMAKAMG